jgi:hypothetical protein
LPICRLTGRSASHVPEQSRVICLIFLTYLQDKPRKGGSFGLTFLTPQDFRTIFFSFSLTFKVFVSYKEHVFSIRNILRSLSCLLHSKECQP